MDGKGSVVLNCLYQKSWHSLLFSKLALEMSVFTHFDVAISPSLSHYISTLVIKIVSYYCPPPLTSLQCLSNFQVHR